MLFLEPVERCYDWGSPTSLREFAERRSSEGPLAELWYGAHRTGASTAYPATSVRQHVGGAAEGTSLDSLIGSVPETILGADVSRRFGGRLPYLLKLIAPGKPLSLQVHPNLARAQWRHSLEEASARDIHDPARNYKDPNHKPELVYALTKFEALSGFRAPRRVMELLTGLDTPLTTSMLHALRARPDGLGIYEAFASLLRDATRPSAEAVHEVAEAAAERLDAGRSPSPRIDAAVSSLNAEYPGDPGAVAALLLNPVTLHPGETLFVPAGSVHVYLSGLAVEIMASSDNVLRAGLTSKHVDIPEMLAAVNYTAAPPVRIAPEKRGDDLLVYSSPVDDFELSTLRVSEGKQVVLPGHSARIILCVEGMVELTCSGASATLNQGQAVFLGADEDDPVLRGIGAVVQADVP